jgi:heme-degrading monooxygenase HmoA
MYADTTVGKWSDAVNGGVSMFVVMNRLETETPERFETVFSRSMRSTLDGVPGLVRASLLRLSKEEGNFVSVLEFEDEAAFKAWMRSDSFLKAHRGVDPDDQPTSSTIETYSTALELGA